MSETCASCKFWRHLEDDEGTCLRYPPQHVGGPGVSANEWLYPETYAIAWCGEWATATKDEPAK
jgi:hypothetical protein